MKRISFTTENRAKNRARLKVQTRRLLKSAPKWSEGDVLAHCEPTHVLVLLDAEAELLYPDTGDLKLKPVSPASRDRLLARKDYHRPAIARFMLNDFARHYLRIAEVRCEPLQSISPEDAIAEGIPATSPDPVGDFRALWESIHGAGSGDENPQVVAYSYEFLWK